MPTCHWTNGIPKLAARVSGGDRFAGIYGSHRGDAAQLHALLVGRATVSCLRTELAPDAEGSLAYPALTPAVPGCVLVRARIA